MTTFTTAVQAAVMAAALAAASVAAAGPHGGAQASAAAPARSRDGQDRRVRIHNQTGWTMTHFHASESHLEDWRGDLLQGGFLPAGSSVAMNIDDGSGSCLYDFRARFSNGQALTRSGVNVCRIADYYFTR